MIAEFDKKYSVYIDGPAGMETYRHVERWRIIDETNLLIFTDPSGKKQHVTTWRYSIEEE